MEIPNLSSNPSSNPLSSPKLSPAPDTKSTPLLSVKILLIVLVIAVGTGYLISRLVPYSASKNASLLSGESGAISTENITDKSAIEVGKLYGDTSTVFKDSAVGIIEKGSINGVGTHILNREGGDSQRASLTSSVVDLDLFIGRKVEVKGETNASKQTSWLLDVGSVKVLE
jgi:hypothetical protein